MADPTLGVASLALGVLGGASSAMGAAGQASSQEQSYKYQAGLALQNQQIQKQNEEYALQEGENKAAQQGMVGAAKMGQIRATQGASGFDVNSGSAKAVQQSQQYINQMDQTITRSNAAKLAYNYDIGAVQAGEQATIDKAAAANIKAAAPLNIASSILGSATGVASKWLGFNQSGVLSGGDGGFGLGPASGDIF